MKKLNLGVAAAMMLAVTGCAVTKKGPSNEQRTASQSLSSEKNQVMQSEAKNQEASIQASELTQGWPEASRTAASEMIGKYGPPNESTSEMLIWKSNIAPFKAIKVHKTVYSHKFPLLHQNALEHVVDYKVPTDKVDNVLMYNEAIVVDKVKGQMSSYAESEAMNTLALNLADEVIQGKMSPDSARVKFGKETLDFMNGNRTAYTSVLSFGGQYQTPDQGKTVTDKIRWIGDPDSRAKSDAAGRSTRQAQEEKKKVE
jgi:hypothetical protein